MNLKKTVLLALLLWANICRADICEPETLQKLAKQIGYQPAKTEISACKQMPNKPQYTLVVIAQFQADPAADEAELVGDYDLDLIVMEAASYKVIKRLTQEKAIPVDAVALTGLTIDTANYNVSKGQRAFGLRIQLSNSSRADPYSQTLLNLYLENDDALREILHGFEVGSHSGEWDGNCRGEFTSTNSTLSIKKPGTPGFSDILVKTQTEVRLFDMEKDECKDQQKSKSSQHSLLSYSNGSYKTAIQ